MDLFCCMKANDSDTVKAKAGPATVAQNSKEIKSEMKPNDNTS